MALDEGDGSDVTGEQVSASGASTGTLAAVLTHWATEAGDQPAFAFVDYALERDGVRHELTSAELDQRTRAVAAALQQRTEPGDRIAILAPQGLEYVVGFLAAIRAGLIAVPLFGPNLSGHAGRLGAVLADSSPRFVLSSGAGTQAVTEFLAEHGLSGEVLNVEDVPDGAAEDFTAVPVDPDDVAYLQYTSGSTRTPAGVMITHRNALANVAEVGKAYDVRRDQNSVVSWLPLFHDMGLVFSLLLPLVAGVPATLMDPMAFVRHPVRWLRLLSDNPGALTAAPNFSYDHCARRVRDLDKVGLVLDGISGFLNGSEPVRPDTLARFTEAFAGAGVRADMHRPSYGLAEATVFVSASPRRDPLTARFDREELAAGVARPAADDAPVSELVSCGSPIDQDVALVDPQTHRLCDGGAVGEIWTHGPSIAAGIWNRPDATEQSFRARLDGDTGGLPAGPWLRTGDLGVRYQGELYITGRIKDLIIIDGRNHYPQDLEATVEEVHPVVRRGTVAAVSVPTEDGEGVVVVAGRAPGVTGFDERALTGAVRKAVSAAHGIALRDFVLVAPGAVPRTSSGKIARAACRQRYLDGELAPTEGAA